MGVAGAAGAVRGRVLLWFRLTDHWTGAAGGVPAFQADSGTAAAEDEREKGLLARGGGPEVRGASLTPALNTIRCYDEGHFVGL